MKKIIVCFMVAGILFSCKQQTTEMPLAKAPVDSLIEKFSQSWSQHDSTGVINLFETNAILTDNNLIALNANEIANEWIHPNIRVVNNFKTTQIQNWSSADRAGYTGSYVFDVIVKDSLVAKPKGLYTLNWIKNENGEWKITTAAIHSTTD